MPELPEVEIIKKQLTNNIIGKNIVDIKNSNLSLHGKPIPNLSKLICQKILNIFRRNKYLILETEKTFLVIHLGMTGQLISADSLPANQKHIHLEIYFDKSILYYKDIRRFGSINLYCKSEYKDYLSIPLFSKLGYEPLDPSFSFGNLDSSIKKSKTTAKNFIMDGKYICGIGNIYASEILFLSKINPTKIINKITKKQKQALYKNIVEVLNKAISLGGSTISDFVHTNGSSGKMQDHYFVYARDSKDCKICGSQITKIKQNGRSTFYCPHCQK